MLRIAAGSLKGLTLQVPPKVRATEGIVRQAIFNILAQRIPGASVLDGCAGSGSLGIEALSRGAARVTFIESDGRHVEAIEANLARLPGGQAAGDWRVVHADIERAVERLARQGVRFDVILLDPPYAEEVAKKALRAVAAYDILAPAGIVCLEHALSAVVEEAAKPLVQIKRHRYGNTVLSFYELAGGRAATDGNLDKTDVDG